MTIAQLRNDEWVHRFWSNCPPEFLAHIVTNVVPAARQDATQWATHKILLDLQASALYRDASRSDQLRLHCLTGRAVRIARGFVSKERKTGARNPCGQPVAYIRVTPNSNP